MKDLSFSTIQLDKKIILELKKAREHNRQTYNELLGKMIKLFTFIKRKKKLYEEKLEEEMLPALLSERALGEVWNTPKEDEAWKDL